MSPRSVVVLLALLAASCGGDNQTSPSPPVAAPVLSVSPSGAGVVNGTQFSFTVTGSSVTPQSTVSWQFGDGSSAVGAATATHTYAQAGTFTVQVAIASSAGQSSAATTVRVETTAGQWYVWIVGHTTYSAKRPIPLTGVDLRLNDALPAQGPPTPLNAVWLDNAACRETSRVYGSVKHPRSVSVGVESFCCGSNCLDFYLHGEADDQLQTISGSCAGGGGPECRFRMTRTVDLSGPWKGTWRSSYGGSGVLTTTFNHSGSALSGSASVTNGGPCFASGAVTGRIDGNSVAMGVTNSSGTEVKFTGAIGVGGGSMTGGYQAVSSQCGYDSGTWTLSRQ